MNQSRIHSFFAPYFLVLGLTIFAHAATGADAPTSDPGKDGDGEYQIGPDYKIDPALTDQGNPKGKSFEFSMPLADSKIFRGDDPTLQPEKKPVRKERMIYVYVPAAYKDGAKAPVLIIHDGPSQLNLVRNALDNLELTQIKCYPEGVCGGVKNISLPHGKMLPEIGGNEDEKYQSARAGGTMAAPLSGARSRRQSATAGPVV